MSPATLRFIPSRFPCKETKERYVKQCRSKLPLSTAILIIPSSQPSYIQFHCQFGKWDILEPILVEILNDWETIYLISLLHLLKPIIISSRPCMGVWFLNSLVFPIASPYITYLTHNLSNKDSEIYQNFLECSAPTKVKIFVLTGVLNRINTNYVLQVHKANHTFPCRY